ncbi:bacilysin biosynthesis protein BacA [Streptomyces sp. NPDC000410]|uniref:bacilysin biosynthesis protein BacA n=1 Tax=Streptomyces sp. NPDC000410 TaxID=3154254 RepID=UPI003323D7C3
MHASSRATTGHDRTPVSRVTTIHTLGPAGTNLEKAAHHWFEEQRRDGRVVLHTEVEDGLDVMRFDGTEAILACAVYPRLHDLVFGNLDRLAMVDTFILDTYDMVLASRPEQDSIATIVTHPAPSCLVTSRGEISFASSNSHAAALCASGLYDSCVTTDQAARSEGLRVVENFGPVPMVFTVHAGRPGPGPALGEAR